MNNNFTKYAFTESVKKAQEENGSRKAYSKMENSGTRNKLTTFEAQFISERDSFYMGTVGENGWPYVQHRGGPKGFIKVTNDSTLIMPDYSGNKQYISIGNLTASNKVSLFLMDYPNKRRLKIWATVEIIKGSENSDVFKSASNENYNAVLERVLKFTIKSYDWNCPQHITPRFTLDEIETSHG
jgi:predicted pyridoxine 5'-phosphate oxidase superfamily flavin-nucleotide-binding protein